MPWRTPTSSCSRRWTSQAPGDRRLAPNALDLLPGLRGPHNHDFGNAILSCWPLEDDTKVLPSQRPEIRGNRRIAVSTTVQIAGRSGSCLIACTWPPRFGNRPDRSSPAACDRVSTTLPAFPTSSSEATSTVRRSRRSHSLAATPGQRGTCLTRDKFWTARPHPAQGRPVRRLDERRGRVRTTRASNHPAYLAAVKLASRNGPRRASEIKGLCATRRASARRRRD